MAVKPGRAWLWGGAVALIVAIVGGVVALRHVGPAAAPDTAASASALLSPSVTGLRWQDLTPAQQEALAPLKSGWDDLGPVRKQKWLEIAGRYASLKPAEKKRMLERMRAWTEMTPEERKAVRENYARAQRAVGGKKAAQWEEYLQLPEEEKRKLAGRAADKPQVAKPPTPKESLAKTPQPAKPHAPIIPPPSMAVTPTPAPVMPLPVPAPAPQPAQELVYPLEGAATPAVMMQQNPSAVAPAPTPVPVPAPTHPAAPAVAAPAPQPAPAPTASSGSPNATK